MIFTRYLSLKLVKLFSLIYFSQGTLKLFLLLLHDFPEFLTEYCFHLLERIPFKAVQLRNIILSAFPFNITPIPDPCNANLKLETLNEILKPVRSLSNTALFDSIPFKKDLDNFFLTRNAGNFHNDLRGFMISVNAEKQTVYNISLINILTLYVGHTAIQAIKTLNLSTVTNSPFYDIFQNLIHMDSQGLFYLFCYCVI